LGGRVPIRHLMPFTTAELKEHFNLEQALQFGLLPGIYFSEKEDFKPKLVTYVDSYLKEEIAAEGIIRKLEPFSRFLEVAGIYAGQSLNFSNISRESSVPLKTVQNYFQILEDTMITFILPAWDKNIKKQLAITPKFYFFDSGITNVLTNHLDEAIDAQQKGHLFEQFIVNECRACKSYQLSLKKLFFWRTQTNNEVDLILANGRKIEAAIEIKYKHELTQKDFSGLDVFHEEHPDTPRYLIYLGDTKAKKQGVHIYNYRQFILDIMPGLL
jgi:predicted AAA+ superfamily ATPase